MRQGSGGNNARCEVPSPLGLIFKCDFAPTRSSAWALTKQPVSIGNQSTGQQPGRLHRHANTFSDDRVCFSGCISHEVHPIDRLRAKSRTKRTGGKPPAVKIGTLKATANRRA